MFSTERPDIVLDGRRYFLASEAAAEFGFTPDHIARLARQGKINGRRIGKKWYVEPESLRAYLKMLGELSRPANLSSEAPERTSAERIAHAMHTYGRHTMRDWSPPNEPSEPPRSSSPVLPLASLALAVILSIAAAYAAFNPLAASTIVSRAQSQFAAASADNSIFDRAAQFLFRAVCPIFKSCDLNDVRVTDAGGANQNIPSTPVPRQAATTASTPSTSSGQASSQTSPEATSGTAPQAASTSPASASPTSAAAASPPVVQRVVERIVERALPTYTIAQGGITEAILNDRLNQLDNKLSSQIFSLSASLTSVPNSLPASGGVTNNIALSQRIDQLDGTTITNPTITGGSITASSIVGTISSAISSALATIDDLTSNTITATNATFTNSTTTNATTTNLYAASLTAGNATTTSLAVLGAATSSFGGGISAARINATATSTLSGLVVDSGALRLSPLDCTSYANGGTLTTDASGNVVCAADDGGAGSTVAGADTQIQFNNGGSFGAAANFTFSSSTGKLAVPYASTTALTTGAQWFPSLSNSGLGVDANGKVYAAATSTLATISGTLALSQLANQNANTVLANATAGLAAPTAIATSSFFGTGAGGQVLAWNSGVPQWVATTTLTNGTGISAVYSATNNEWTINNTGALFGYPFTASTTFATTTSATTSSISTQGVFFASSTAAASQFPFASTTAITISGTASTTNLTVSSLNAANCDVKASAAGVLSCGTDATGLTAYDAWTHQSYAGQVTAATTSTLWLTNTTLSLAASSTFANFASSTNASSSFATIGTQWFTGLTNSGLGVDANGKVYAAATSTLATISGTLALSQLANQNANTVLANATAGLAAPTAIATSSLFGTGTGGTVLSWSNGVPQWVATTTFSSGTGINLSYTGNTWTIANIVGYPFTANSTFATSTAATTSSISTQGVFFASSTAAASQFPFASTTAITISGTASTSLFFANGLSTCTSNNVLTWSGGTFGCEADDTATGQADPFAWENDYAAVNAATTSILWAKSGVNASSTSHFANASTTNLTAIYASSTQGFFGSLSLGNLSGFLKATAGSIATALINLASDVTGTLGVGNGGTGWANIAASAIPFGNGSSALATTSPATPGYVLAYLGGIPTWTATTTFSTGLTYANGAVTCDTASGSALGCLSSADWTTFNNKQSALGFTPPPNTRSIATTYPLQGGGDLSADRTLSLAFGTTTANSWSQLQTFSNGFLTLASSTIGDGTQSGGLTISGGATTTGNLAVTGTGSSYFTGNVGIGTVSPHSGSKLQVVGGILANGAFSSTVGSTGGFDYGSDGIRLFSMGTSGSTKGTYSFFAKGADNSTNIPMVIDSSGNVGIASTSPWRTLSTAGTVGFDGLTAGAGAGSLCLSANKEVTYSAGAGCTGSSQRFKHDISPLDASTSLDEVLKLNPVSFVYNDDIGVKGPQVGLIAEQVQQVDPRLVATDASSTPFTVKYENLTAILAAAIQQLAHKLSDLATTVASFADRFTTRELTFVRAEGDYISVREVNARERLCVHKSDGTPACITGDQLAALLSQSAAGFANPSPAAPAPTTATTAPSVSEPAFTESPLPMTEPTTIIDSPPSRPNKSRNRPPPNP